MLFICFAYFMILVMGGAGHENAQTCPITHFRSLVIPEAIS